MWKCISTPPPSPANIDDILVQRMVVCNWLSGLDSGDSENNIVYLVDLLPYSNFSAGRGLG